MNYPSCDDMKLKNVTKENIELINEFELFARKSQTIDFVEVFSTNKEISEFISQYGRATTEEKVDLHKYILHSLKGIHDRALFIQNHQVTNYFSILPYEDLKLLQTRYFKKVNQKDLFLELTYSLHYPICL